MRRSLIVAVALLAVAFVFVGGPSLLLSPTTDNVAPETQDEPDPGVVVLEGSESGFWPYLTPEKAFQKRSPINVVVRGETDDVIRALTEGAGGEDNGTWEDVDEDEEEADPDTYAILADENATDDNETSTVVERDGQSDGDDSGANSTDDGSNATENETDGAKAEGGPGVSLDWGAADGAVRYAYIEPGNGEDGYFTTETHQLQDGDYYGQRYHIRMYESPDEDDQWVAMQAHTEHFDWFTLRHRVSGSQAAQAKIESDLMALPWIDARDDVARVYLENDGPSDADGWTTVVDLRTASMALTPLAIGLAANRKRERRRDRDGDGTTDRDGDSNSVSAVLRDHLTQDDRRRLRAAYDRLEAGHIVMMLAIIALLLGVRIAGIALERRVGFLTPHMIAALLYPFVSLGIPVATYAIARSLTRRLDAALAAAGALAVAIWLDYGLLGVDTIPVDVIVQRMLAVVALGLIAGGAVGRATAESRFNDMLLVGAATWVLVLGGTLFGYL
ncbi:monovalent cation/H(+) antiporter subunit G [Natrialbaceae archaeon GCM10025810]|uniref:monovalent cation/H(+) antiporter subunit G n=1 Tax=Halovalidus salilacus TaxID=3075124 RepID=UPI003616C253